MTEEKKLEYYAICVKFGTPKIANRVGAPK